MPAFDLNQLIQPLLQLNRNIARSAQSGTILQATTPAISQLSKLEAENILLQIIKPEKAVLKNNTVIQAKVLQVSKESLILQINNKTFEVRIAPRRQQAAFYQYDQLQLQVIKKNNAIQLKLLQQQSPQKEFHKLVNQLTEFQFSDKMDQNPAIKPLLQLSGLIKQIQAIDSREIKATKLPQPLKEINQLLRQIIPAIQKQTNVASPNSKELEQIIRQSGIFYEQTLLNFLSANTSKAELQNDLKFLLLALAVKLKPLQKLITTDKNLQTEKNLPQSSNPSNNLQWLEILLNTLESSINKITYHQLQSQNDGLMLLWNIPLLQTETSAIELTVETEKRKTKDASRPWSFFLDMQLEHAGILQIKCDIFNKDIKLSFWTEQQTTFTIVKDKQSDIQQMLARAGFQVLQIEHYPYKRKANKNKIKQYQQAFFHAKA